MSLPKPIVVLGAEGQLGAELCRQLGERAVGLGRHQCDLLEPDRVAEVLKRLQPLVVINTAAYTAVDRAEQEPALCHAMNADAVAALASLCRELDSTLVQISTDYVFGADLSRQVPYAETDAPGAINVYGQSKLAGERHAAAWKKHLVVRTCGLYGRRKQSAPSNFVETMLRLARERDRLRIVDDQRCTPSYVIHVARAIVFLSESNARGIYHVTCDGEATWHEFATEIFRLARLSPQVDRISTAEYAVAASRPLYSVLATSKYQATAGAALPHWKAAIAEYMQTIA